MNKEDLAKDVARRLNISERKAEQAISAVFDSITNALANGQSVRLQNFGLFYLDYKDKRKARKFPLDKMVEVQPRVSPGFKAGKLLKNSVMNISNFKDERMTDHDE